MASTLASGAFVQAAGAQPVLRLLQAFRSHVSTSASLLLAAITAVVAAAARDTPLDVRTSPSHFTGFSLLVAVLFLVPVLDSLQLLLHSRSVHSERVLLGARASVAAGTAAGGGAAALAPTVLLQEREHTLRSYAALTAARARTPEAYIGSVLLGCGCAIGRAAAAAARLEGEFSRTAPPLLRRVLRLLKQSTASSLALTIAMGVVFGAPTEEDEFLSAQMSVFAARWAVRACALALCVSSVTFVGLHGLASVLYTQPHASQMLTTLATRAGQECVAMAAGTDRRSVGDDGGRSSQKESAAAGDHGGAGREPAVAVAADAPGLSGTDITRGEGEDADPEGPAGSAATPVVMHTLAGRSLTDWQVLLRHDVNA